MKSHACNWTFLQSGQFDVIKSNKWLVYFVPDG